MAVIRVPKTPPQAYNPKRKPGDLLQRHLKHLEWAVRPAAQRAPGVFHVEPAATEGEAAARIAALTRQLREQSNPPPILERFAARTSGSGDGEKASGGGSAHADGKAR